MATPISLFCPELSSWNTHKGLEIGLAKTGFFYPDGSSSKILKQPPFTVPSADLLDDSLLSMTLSESTDPCKLCSIP